MKPAIFNRFLSHVGEKHHDLTILEVLRECDKDGRILCRCKCECGRERVLACSRVLSGNNKSCGMCGYQKRRAIETMAADLTNEPFGRLTALYPLPERRGSNIVWMCRCECGRMHPVPAHYLLNGDTKSCGQCGYKEEMTSRLKRKYETDDEHHLANVYSKMCSRCYNPNDPEYIYYGGRNPPVWIYQPWLDNPMDFIQWAVENGYQQGLEIDRFPDKFGPYVPWNVRWATSKQQNNNRSNNRLFSIGGKLFTLSQMCERLDLNYKWAQSKSDRDLALIFDAILSKSVDEEILESTKDLPNPDIWQTDPTWLPLHGFEPLEKYEHLPEVAAINWEAVQADAFRGIQCPTLPF